MMNYAKIPYKSTIHLHRGLSTRSLIYCTRTEGRKTNISSAMEECTNCFDNNASEAEVVTDMKKLRKVNCQIR